MTGGPGHTYCANRLGCIDHTCCAARPTRVALTLSPTVNMPEGMLRINDHR
jgi:hypothetical protein